MSIFSFTIIVLWCLLGLSIHGKAVNYGALTVVEQEDDTDVTLENDSERSNTDTANIAPIKYDLFQPTNEWQTVRDDQAIPAGLHVRMNLQTGKKEAKLMDEQPDYNSWRDGDRHGMLNMNRKQLSMNELKKALKDFKTTELDDTDLEREAEVKEKFKSYDDLKKDFLDMNMNIKTDAEIIEGLLTKMKHKDTSGDDLLTILTDLEYYLHQIDNAILFKDMGGIPHILNILNTSDIERLQIEAALVLGAATSSNPKVQIGALEAGALPLLLRLLSVNSPLTLKRKLIFCLSTLCRHFPYAQKRFLKLGGLVALRNVFDQPGIEKVNVKIVSLLNDLLVEKKITVENSEKNVAIDTEKIKQYKQVNLLETMIDQGWCERVMSLLQLTDHESREHVLSAMQTLMKSCETTFIKSIDDLISLRSEYLQLSQHEEKGDDYFTSILSVINHLLHDIGIKNEL